MNHFHLTLNETKKKQERKTMTIIFSDKYVVCNRWVSNHSKNDTIFLLQYITKSTTNIDVDNNRVNYVNFNNDGHSKTYRKHLYSIGLHWPCIRGACHSKYLNKFVLKEEKKHFFRRCSFMNMLYQLK